MTAQLSEVLYYNNKTYHLETEPLGPLFDLMGEDKPILVAKSTACWRGYLGTWEIEDDRLFLIDFKGCTTNYAEVGMDFLFPNQKRVLAGWFTGEIKIPQGKSRQIGYGIFRFQKYLFLEFKKGFLVGSREVDNTQTFNKDIKIGKIDLP